MEEIVKDILKDKENIEKLVFERIKSLINTIINMEYVRDYISKNRKAIDEYVYRCVCEKVSKIDLKDILHKAIDDNEEIREHIANLITRNIEYSDYKLDVNIKLDKKI